MASKKDFQKQVYVVIGLGRSGTSTVTRSLQALGVSLGDKITGDLNAKGSFEDYGVSRIINRRVLKALNYSWKMVAPTESPLDEDATLHQLKQEAKQLLEARFAKTDHFAFKAISTAKTLTFWQAVFKEMRVGDHYIIALRNPLAAAFSYQRINGADIELSLMQWLMHIIPAIENTAHKNRIIVSYDALLNEPRTQMERIQNRLYIPVLTGEKEKNEFVNDFLQPDLKHHACTLDDLKNHAASRVTPMVVAMYELLLSASRDDIQLESQEFASAWEALRQAFDALHPLYGYIDTLLTQHKTLERTLRTARKSIVWKLMYPLRLLDDALRSLRKKSRERRKLLTSSEGRA